MEPRIKNQFQKQFKQTNPKNAGKKMQAPEIKSRECIFLFLELILEGEGAPHCAGRGLHIARGRL